MDALRRKLKFFSKMSMSFVLYKDLQGAPKYSNEFLAIGVGADALGLGNSVVAQTGGVMSGYWNPAGLTKVDKWLEKFPIKAALKMGF